MRGWVSTRGGRPCANRARGTGESRGSGRALHGRLPGNRSRVGAGGAKLTSGCLVPGLHGRIQLLDSGRREGKGGVGREITGP